MIHGNPATINAYKSGILRGSTWLSGPEVRYADSSFESPADVLSQWVFPATYLPRWLIPAIARKDPLATVAVAIHARIHGRARHGVSRRGACHSIQNGQRPAISRSWSDSFLHVLGNSGDAGGPGADTRRP